MPLRDDRGACLTVSLVLNYDEPMITVALDDAMTTSTQAEVAVLQSSASYTLDELAQIATEPLQRAGSERAIAFGSYARGTADGYSDLDLVVVLRTHRPPLERWPLLRELLDALPVPVDLLVYTPKEFALGMERRVGIFDAIAREGALLYARPGS